jgi:EmrB/QacA subfamily drug resistance transporter
MSAVARSDERETRRRWLALFVVCLAMLMNVLDLTVVNVALPKIQNDLHFTQSGLAWVIDAYMVAFGGFLLMSGRLGDLVGRKKIFLVGLAIFTAASLVCGFASSQGLLIGARFVQGLAGSLSTSVILAIIATEFTDPRERAKAMSAYIFVAVGGGSIGLVAGGLITQALNWHWIFFINLPIGGVALVLGALLVRENEGLGWRQGVDVLGSVLITGGLMLLVYAIVKSTEYGLASAHTLGFGGLALALIAGFVLLESRLRNPIMPLRIFAVPGLASSSLIRACLFVGMYGVFFLGTLYFERVLGYGALRTGLSFLPMTLIVAVMSMGVTARLVTAFGPRRVALPGILCAVAAVALLSQISVHGSYFPLMVLSFLLFGFGMGSASVPLLTLAMAHVPGKDAGLASGVVNVSMQVAGALGVAVLSTISTDRTKTLTRLGHPLPSALTGGYQVAFIVAAATAAVAFLLALTIVRSPPRRQEEPATREQGVPAAAEA